MTYLPKPWNLNKDMMESEYVIFEETIGDQEKRARLCTGLIALLYEQLLLLHGDPLSEIYPIDNNEKARKYLTIFYSSSVFLNAYNAFDLAARGHYIESQVIVRLLWETHALNEYFNINEPACLPFIQSKKAMPDKKKVYRYLKEHGQIPRGGPEKIIARFHQSAHANLDARMMTWVVKDDQGDIKGFHIHKYDSHFFYSVAHHLVTPLIAAHQFLFLCFRGKMENNEDFLVKWNAGRPFDLLEEEFPDLWRIVTQFPV